MTGRVLIFGAGPAGMAAAISAAREGASVTLVEKTDRVGRKLSMTGNGRGNLTNTSIVDEAYHTSSNRRPMSFPGVDDEDELLVFFESLGVLTRAEGNFVYPVSGQASSVAEALESAVERSGITVIKNAQLKSVDTDANGGFICVAGGKEYRADAVILATGGKSGPSTCHASGDAWYICEKLGLKTFAACPSLVPLITDDDTLPEKTGVRAWGNVKIFAVNDSGEETEIAEEFGEVQFTRSLLSGMPVLQASGRIGEVIGSMQSVSDGGADKIQSGSGRAADEMQPVSERVSVEMPGSSMLRAEIDLFPEYDDGEWVEKFRAALTAGGDRNVTELLHGLMNAELASAVIKRLGLDGGAQISGLSDIEKEEISRQLKHFSVKIRGVGSFERAQATAGGVSLDELNDDFSCKKIPGLYIAGELLDADGRCGGYNLHWAFLTGLISGRSAGKRVL